MSDEAITQPTQATEPGPGIHTTMRPKPPEDTTQPSLNDLLEASIRGRLKLEDAARAAGQSEKEFRRLQQQRRKRWPKTERDDVARRLLRGDCSLEHLASEFELSTATLREWRREFLDENPPRLESVEAENLTAARLEIQPRIAGSRAALRFAPLQKREVEDPAAFPLEDWAAANTIRFGSEGPAKQSDAVFAIVFWVVALVVGGVIWLQSKFPFEQNLPFWIGGAVVVCVLAWIGWKARAQGMQAAGQIATLLTLLAVGAGLFGAAWSVAAEAAGPGRDMALMGLLCTFVTMATLLPALLFFLFDREGLPAIRERFYRDLLRLDPRVTSRTDVEARYGSELEAAFGRSRSTLLPGTRWPLVVATMMIAIGWWLTMLPLPLWVQAQAFVPFRPNPTPLAFAFLGAYFFALNVSVRSHLRRDLRPSAYSAIAVRIFTSAILAFLVDASLRPAAADVTGADTAQALDGLAPAVRSISAPLSGGWLTLWLCFGIGLFPESFLTLFQEKVGSIAGLVEGHPLTKLEGIDIYDRARLSDEGVTNVEALAHHDLVQLLLRTRIPASRLVDWLDQAILYLHVAHADPAQDGEARVRPSLIERLRTHGIRTATDLMAVDHAAADSAATLAMVGGSESKMRVVLNALADDEWLSYVLHWRRSGMGEVRTIRSPEAVLSE